MIGGTRVERQMTQRNAERVSCQRCRYFQVTWDPDMPYGCKAHGFKSKENPAAVVFESSGLACQLFSPKREKK